MITGKLVTNGLAIDPLAMVLIALCIIMGAALLAISLYVAWPRPRKDDRDIKRRVDADQSNERPGTG